MFDTAKKVLAKIGLIKPNRYVVRQYGTILGSFTAVSEDHALDTMAQSFGHKNFEELGVSREAHKLEVVK